MLPITNLYVALAERIAARLGSPRVRTLHLPQQEAGKDAEFCALELEDGSIGFSFVKIGDVEPLLRKHPDIGAFAGMEAAVLARGYAGSDPAGKALGFAAINALSQQLFSRANWTPSPADDSLGEIVPKSGEQIGMIGLFRPLLGRVLASGARLTVVELKAELAGAADGYRVTLDAAELATCEKVVSTSTLLLNDTLDNMLEHCRSARWFAMVGPGAGCLPDALFARGITLVGGNWITNGAGFVDALTRGESTSPFSVKSALTRENYPGFTTLLARAGKTP